MANPQIPALTGLRFIAALCVVIAHAVSKFVPMNHPWPVWYLMVEGLAGLGMQLFFVLSGFVIQYNYSGAIRENPFTGTFNFFIARFARLYPLYILGLGYDLLNSYSFYQTSPYLVEALPHYLTLTQSWVYMILGDRSLIFVFGVLPTVSWSVSTEWFFYLSYPLIRALLAPVGRPRTLVILAACLVCLAVGTVAMLVLNENMLTAIAVRAFGPLAASTDLQLRFVAWLTYFSPYVTILQFLLGCLLASIFMRLPAKVEASSQQAGSLVLALAIVWTVVIFGATFLVSPNVEAKSVLLRRVGTAFGYAPGLAIVIFCCARYRNSIVRLLGSRVLVLCGEASYSLYLLHLVVIERMGISSPLPDNLRTALGAASRIAFCILTCIGVSLVTWRLVEVPARYWLRNILQIRVRHPMLGRSMQF